MGKAADEASSQQSTTQTGPMPPPETPRKAVKTDMLSTPGKRRYDEINEGLGANAIRPIISTGNGKDGNVFTTPSTATNSNLFDAILPTSAETPTPIRYENIPSSQDSDLATEIFTSLQTALSAPLYSEAREAVKNVCNRHVMYTRGIMKGRDVSRAMVKKKDERITELEGEIEWLKSQREADRAIIKVLRRKLAQAIDGDMQ